MRNRLTLLVLLPLLAAVGLGAARINTLYQDESHFRNAHFEAQTTSSVEEVLLALQQERLAGSVCLAVIQPCTVKAADSKAGGNADKKTALETYVNAYTDAQAATTAAITQVSGVADQVINSTTFSGDLRSAATEAFGRVDDLAQLRKIATGSSVQSNLIFRAYSSIIDDVVAVIGQTSAGTSDALVSQDNASLAAIDNLVEAQSIAQAYTEQVIAGGNTGGQGPNPNAAEARLQAGGLNQAIASQSSAQNTFLAIAAPSLVQSYQATVSGPDITASQAAVNRALAILQGTATWNASGTQLGAAVVDEALPATIGDLRTVQGTTIQQLTTDSQTLLSNAQSDLYKNVAMVLLALLLSFLGIALVARSLVGPLQVLRTGALEIAANRLPEIVRRLRDADGIDADATVDPIPISSNDEIGQVARAFDEVHQQAVRLASEQALLRSNVNSMFVNLSRRSQSLVQRQLRLIDELENSEQDPDQLANLFKLDHLATRMRRNGENLLVLAGEEPGRKWSQAVRLLDVMRAGASEVEQYERVALRDLPDVNVLGRVVNDLVHLVAELLENATSFSAPETKVSVTANMLNTGGVMLEIEDAGIGMTPEELDDANERLANPPVIDVAISRRMGLYVVGRLATRHGIQVRLRRSAGGGITALVLVPSALLAGAEGEQHAPTPELSATGARSLGALPRRGGGQLGFPEQAGPGAAEGAGVPREGAGAPPYRGAAPGGLGASPAGLSNGDQFPDLPPFGGAPARPGEPDELPRRAEPLGEPGTGNRGPSIPGARTPFEDRPAGPDGLRDPEVTTQFPTVGSGRPGPGGPQDSGQFKAFGGPRDGAERPDQGGAPGQFGMPGMPPAAAPAPPARTQDPSSTGQFPRIQDPASTGQFPRIQDPASTGQLPRFKDPSSTGQFPRVKEPGAPARPPRAANQPGQDGPQFPAPSGPPAGRQDAPAGAPGPFPPAPQGPAFPGPAAPPFPAPAESQAPSFPGPAAPPAQPAPQQPAPQRQAPQQPVPQQQAPAAQPPAPVMPPAASAPPLEQRPMAPAAPPTAVERLFAQDPLPPAPVTDERLPIFEAMESEWFRRRDEARAQAAMAQSNTVLPPLIAPKPAPPSPAAAGAATGGGSGNGNGNGGKGSGKSPAGLGSPLGAGSGLGAGVSAGTGAAGGPANGSGTAELDSSGVGTSGAGSRGSSSHGTGSNGSAPSSAAATSTPSTFATPPAPATAASASAPSAAPADSPAPAGFPVQPLATASATSEPPAADSRGASPMENTGTWSSPGDEGWKAAQAAAKPVAAGLTQKGLPKRVPKSNLVPGSAGGMGAAKASPPVIPPRSAEAVRGRLSSFHQGLRQGRDAATTADESGKGAGQDGKKDA